MAEASFVGMSMTIILTDIGWHEVRFPTRQDEGVAEGKVAKAGMHELLILGVAPISHSRVAQDAAVMVSAQTLKGLATIHLSRPIYSLVDRRAFTRL